MGLGGDYKLISLKAFIQPTHPSIMETVAQFDIDFARVVPMETAEGLAVVEIHAAVGHVQGVQRGGNALTEVLAERQIERGVLGQMPFRIRVARERVTEA